MSKRAMALLAGVSLVMAFALGGCFSSPTNPHEGVFTSVSSNNTGGHHTPGVPTQVPTGVPTVVATPTPGTGGGSISGSIAGATGTVTIQATHTTSVLNSRQTSISGNGAYTISGLVDGVYTVYAMDTNGHVGNYLGGSGTVTISGGNAVTGIDITMF
jgi:hypothetical protein